MRENLYASSSTTRVPSGSSALSGSSAASDGTFSSKIIRVVSGATFSTAAENVWRRQTAATVGSPTPARIIRRWDGVGKRTGEEMLVDARELDVRLGRARHDKAVDDPVRDRLG